MLKSLNYCNNCVGHLATDLHLHGNETLVKEDDSKKYLIYT